MADPALLYDKDFYAWTRQQAEALRDAAAAGANLPLDWENLAEEMESLGRSERRELRSRLRTIIEHLLKLEYSRASNPRADWSATIRRERREVADLLNDSPSLRPQIHGMIGGLGSETAKLVGDDLIARGEIDKAVVLNLVGTRYAEEQVLGDWFPGHPGEI